MSYNFYKSTDNGPYNLLATGGIGFGGVGAVATITGLARNDLEMIVVGTAMVANGALLYGLYRREQRLKRLEDGMDKGQALLDEIRDALNEEHSQN